LPSYTKSRWSKKILWTFGNSNNLPMNYNENDFKPRRKPSLLLEILASIFMYGPMLAFFYVIVKAMGFLFD